MREAKVPNFMIPQIFKYMLFLVRNILHNGVVFYSEPASSECLAKYLLIPQPKDHSLNSTFSTLILIKSAWDQRARLHHAPIPTKPTSVLSWKFQHEWEGKGTAEPTRLGPSTSLECTNKVIQSLGPGLPQTISDCTAYGWTLIQ